MKLIFIQWCGDFFMRPYCPNNSNFTFREICCGPPIHNDCCCNNNCDYDCNCGNNCNCGCKQEKHNCNCNKPKPPCKPKDEDKEKCCKSPYICVPIKKSHTNVCNPFLYVMIGYMIGNAPNFCEELEQDDNIIFR